MNTHADKTQENKDQAAANKNLKKQPEHESDFQFEDKRPEAISQQKLHDIATNSQTTSQISQLQSIANSPNTSSVQKQENEEEEIQLGTIQKKENKTGLPDNLKAGIENLYGYSMDDVKVHRNSDKPAQLQAHAFAQGNQIHLAPGQEKHLPHEAWHVVQQKQGRVKPTTQMKGGVNLNDDAGLEKEADVMGAKAASVEQIVVQNKKKGHGIKFGIDGQAKSLEKIAMSFSPYMSSIQRFEKPTVQKKRERDKDEDKSDISQLRQFKKSPRQLYSKVTQLAIGSTEEAPSGTRIMVVNPSARDTGDLGTVIRPSTVRENCMAVEFDNEPGIYYRVYFNEINVVTKPKDQSDEQPLPESEILKSMIDKAIREATGVEDELNEVMSTDKTETHKKLMLPAAQLKKCLIDCEHSSAEETAQYMYTTYFYGPLNRYLRNPEVRLKSNTIQKLIDILHAFLSRAFNKTTAESQVSKYRMELQAEWIDKTVPKDAVETGDALSFKAFTSTHPELAGVNGMWPDIENGSFGDVTKLALLVFQGTSKYLYPNKKYFPSEHEHILPPDTETKIVKKYPIQWTDYGKPLDDPRRIWIVTVYHLTIDGSGNVDDFNLDFDDYGNIVSK